MKLSIITPVFNRRDCLERCVESVIHQLDNHDDVEQVIVDDGSTDGTADEAVRLKDKYGEKLKVYIFPENRGTNAARNRAAQEASGEFVMFLDSDDELAPGAINCIFKAFEQFPEFKHYLFACDDRQEYMDSLGDRRVFYFEDFFENKVSGDFAHVFLRRTMLDFPFDEHLRIYEGTFFYRFYLESRRILYINSIVLHRDRNRNDHVTYDFFPTNRDRLCRRIDAIKLRCEMYREQFLANERTREIYKANLIQLYKFMILAGMNRESNVIAKQINPPILYRIIGILHLNRVAWWGVKSIFVLKQHKHKV